MNLRWFNKDGKNILQEQVTISGHLSCPKYEWRDVPQVEVPDEVVKRWCRECGNTYPEKGSVQVTREQLAKAWSECVFGLETLGKYDKFCKALGLDSK